MSDFLLVIPEGWTSLDWPTVQNSHSSMNMVQVLDWINAHYYIDMEEILKSGGFIPTDASLVEAKLIEDSYFMVRLG